MGEGWGDVMGSGWFEKLFFHIAQPVIEQHVGMQVGS
jgi:hypothetical protein